MEKCDQCGAEGQGLTMQHGTNCPKQPLGVGQPQMRGAWSNADSGAYGSEYQGQACDTPPNEPVAASETVTAADGNVWRNVKFGKPMLDAIVDVIYDDGRQVRGAVAASLFWVGATHWRLSELPVMTTAVEAPGLFANMSKGNPNFDLNAYAVALMEGNNGPIMQQDTENLLVKAGFAKDIAIRVATRIGMQDNETRLRGERGAELLAAEATLHRMGYTWEGGGEWKPPLGKAPAFSAPDLLDAAAGHMRDRAAQYDKPEGERSMGNTVAAFNAITGRALKESEGWLLLALLKMIRSETTEAPHRDSVEDLIAYAGLYGEARIGGK